MTEERPEPTDERPEPTDEPSAPRDRRAILTEVAVIYGAIFLGTAALGGLAAVPALRDAAYLAISVLFLYVPLRLARREHHGARRYGIDLAGVLEPPDESRGGLGELARTVARALPSALRETAAAAAVGAIVFPPFVIGFWLYHQPSRPFALDLPPDLLGLVLTQLVLVGLTEEALFRGYVQTRLHDAFPPNVRIFGASLHPGVLVLQAVLFAVVHLATEPSPAKLAVFFPGLLFGWLRARRGGIGAPIVLHAMSNVLAEILVRGWLA